MFLIKLYFTLIICRHLQLFYSTCTYLKPLFFKLFKLHPSTMLLVSSVSSYMGNDAKISSEMWLYVHSSRTSSRRSWNTSASASLSQNTRAHRTSRRQSMSPLIFPIFTFLFSPSLPFLFSPNPRLLFPSSPTSYLPFFYKLFTLSVFAHFLIYFFLPIFSILFLFQCFLSSCADIFKLSRSPGIDS